jgi:hypothetical protein
MRAAGRRRFIRPGPFYTKAGRQYGNGIWLQLSQEH